MSIKIIVAEPHGYCGNNQFGVQRAIKTVQDTAKKYPGKTYLLGAVVHNQHVVDWLEEDYGVKTVDSLKEIPRGARVIIRAHGAPPEVYQKAKKRNLYIVDATCPLVRRAHEDVKKLAAEGKKILYIASKKDHDEAVGVAGEAPAVVELTTLKELDRLKIKEPKKTVVLTQTTLSILETKDALKRLKTRYPEITIRSHICMATTERQKAVIDLAKKTGLVVVIGHPTSSNSNRLREVAETAGARAYIVDTAEELKPKWFKKTKKVAVSSGASTPEWLLKEVIKKIKTF